MAAWRARSFVDLARTPVYLWRSGDALRPLVPIIAVAMAGVLVGTMVGERVFLGLTVTQFRRVVGVLVLLFGLTILLRAV